MKYDMITFRRSVRAPVIQTFLETVAVIDGYTITRDGDDVIIGRASWNGALLVVPWAQVAYAWAAAAPKSKAA